MKNIFITFVFCACAVNSFAQYSFGVKYYPSAKIQSEDKQIYSFDFGYTNKLFKNSIFSSETFFGFDYFDNAIKSGNFNVLFFIPYAYSLREKEGVCVSPGIALGVNFDGTPNYTLIVTPQLSIIIPVNKENYHYLNIKAGYELSSNSSLLNRGLFIRLGLDFW